MLEFENEQVGKITVGFVDNRWKVSLQDGFEFFAAELIEIDSIYHFVYLLEHFEDADDVESIVIERILIPIPQQIYKKMQDEYKLYKTSN